MDFVYKGGVFKYSSNCYALIDQDYLPSFVPKYTLSLQNGPIKEHGVNGWQNEMLIAVVIDRIKGYQETEFRCDSNALALVHLKQALVQLELRTAERVSRGVEGTSTP